MTEQTVGLRLRVELIEVVDAIAKDEKLTRAEVLRRLVRMGIREWPRGPARPRARYPSRDHPPDNDGCAAGHAPVRARQASAPLTGNR